MLPPEFTWRDYTVFLLTIAAQIEHSLMVQYLYAAYSLGGPQLGPPVTDQQRNSVAAWRQIILGIAKEEMGHLVTVQNVLRFLGAPLSLDREDYPWDSQLAPYPFSARTFVARLVGEIHHRREPRDVAVRRQRRREGDN